MGMIIPKVPTGTNERSDFNSSIAVLAPAADPPHAGPDAYLLNPADFPERDLPLVNAPREARYQAVFRQSVLDEIHAHGKSSPEAEVCGVLIGDVYSDRLGCWAYVENCIRGNDADGKQQFINTLREGEFFGERALLSGQVRSATIVAKDAVETYTLGKTDFQAALAAIDSFKQQIYKAYFQRQ